MTSSASQTTRAVRASIESDTQYGAVVPPLHLSSNFAFAGLGEPRQYDYTRSGNPTRDALADAMAELEGGAGAVVTSSGMAALTLLTQLLEPGDTIIAPHDCYGGTFRLFEQQSKKGLFNVLFVDQTNLDALRKAAECRPRIILAETPSNPLLRVVDIEKIAEIASDAGALLAVDNTFLSPALQNPIEFGADLVIHSTTKYINGHSDVVGGCVVAATDELAEEIAYWANCIGITGAPFDSFLTLNEHEQVAQVFYPGLPSHPGHDIAKRQQRGFGGMVSFEIEGGEEELRAFVDSLKFFSLAESLGGVESLVCHPASMTHAPLNEAALKKAGISQNLVRLSIGLESSEDLIADLLEALEAARCAGTLTPVAAACG